MTTQQQDEEKKRRLEAWRRKQQQSTIKVSLKLMPLTKKPTKKKPTKKAPPPPSVFGGDDDDDDSVEPEQFQPRKRKLDLYDPTKEAEDTTKESKNSSRKKSKTDSSNKKTKRWDAAPQEQQPDALDRFMNQLESGTPNGVAQNDSLQIDVGGSVMRASKPTKAALYSPKDWLSDAPPEDNEEDEETARRKLIEALLPPQKQQKQQPVLKKNVQLALTKQQRHLQQLEQAVKRTKQQLAQHQSDFGRIDQDEQADGVLEEAERAYIHATSVSATNSLIMAELNKKKELNAVNHAEKDYPAFVKNLYRIPRKYASWSHDQIIDKRAKLHVRVRGKGAPAPVSEFRDLGLPTAILDALEEHGIHQPYPIQAQAIPCVLGGRDVIGIAKTGSGKTLAYALPLLRHISVQDTPGPRALVLAPARELAVQIHTVIKTYAKVLGLHSTAVYGGAGVGEQIAEMKRGADIIVATPGRLIDFLTLQNGRLLTLENVTFVVMDEADRMFDMGFAPQITAILSAIRPDRQTLLFSATFPKQIEKLARQSLKVPLEIVVGGRSVASDKVTQYAELVEEDDKFLRLLQILGEQVEGLKKVIVFVDTQVRADSLFEQLLRNGYSTLSLHGGKEQEDRDSTISDFKRKDGPNILVATGVAARGLDIPTCTCVVNFCCPNHLEAYVHQAGRTGRAGNTGVCYTLVSTEESNYAPIVCRAMVEAGQVERIDPKLKQLSDDFKAKVEKGEARFAGSGFKGKGFSYNADEMNEAQKVAQREKRQLLIEAGAIDPEDEDTNPDIQSKTETKDTKPTAELDIPENLTPEMLALPGMKEALLRKAGIAPTRAPKKDPSLGRPVQMAEGNWVQEFEINDYPREARFKVTQKETTLRMQDEYRTAVTLKGSYVPPGKKAPPGERRVYLHLQAADSGTLQTALLEIQRLLNEETIKVKGSSIGGNTSTRYNVLA